MREKMDGMEAQLGQFFDVAGLKEVILDDYFEITVLTLVAKSDGKKPLKDESKAETSDSKTILDPVKLEKDERAKDMIIVNIEDHVLRNIKMTTAAAMRSMLERLYISKSLPNRIFVQSQFYTFRCDGSKSIYENVDMFLKIVVEMSSLNVNVTDEIQAIVFLSSLPASYDQLKHTLKYGKDSLTLEEVISAARSKQRDMAGNNKMDNGYASVLYTNDKGRSQKRESNDSRGRSRNKSKTKKVGCMLVLQERL